jgi:hypothetical protein
LKVEGQEAESEARGKVFVRMRMRKEDPPVISRYRKGASWPRSEVRNTL